MTVADLIEALEGMDPQAEVRLAMQPSWPMEYTVADAVEDQTGIVYLSEDRQVGYLPEPGREAVGW